MIVQVRPQLAGRQIVTATARLSHRELPECGPLDLVPVCSHPAPPWPNRVFDPPYLSILRGRNVELAFLDAYPALVHRRYPELDCGQSGGRLLTLRGATLLHVAAEFGFFDAARLLLDRGAGVNPRADVDANGVGGQTPIFHALTSNAINSKVVQLLTDRGADLSLRARVPGHHARPDEILDVSTAEYGAIFPLR